MFSGVDGGLIIWFFSKLVGEEVYSPTAAPKATRDPRIQGFKGLFSNDLLSAFNILSISA